MKIAFISQEQYNTLWKRLQPQDRMVAMLPCRTLMLHSINTLLIADEAPIVSAEDALKEFEESRK